MTCHPLSWQSPPNIWLSRNPRRTCQAQGRQLTGIRRGGSPGAEGWSTCGPSSPWASCLCGLGSWTMIHRTLCPQEHASWTMRGELIAQASLSPPGTPTASVLTQQRPDLQPGPSVPYQPHLRGTCQLIDVKATNNFKGRYHRTSLQAKVKVTG